MKLKANGKHNNCSIIVTQKQCNTNQSKGNNKLGHATGEKKNYMHAHKLQRRYQYHYP